MKSLNKDLTAITGTLYRNTKSPNGTEKPNSAYSFIGVFILCLPTAANGIQDGCIKKDILLTSIM